MALSVCHALRVASRGCVPVIQALQGRMTRDASGAARALSYGIHSSSDVGVGVARRTRVIPRRELTTVQAQGGGEGAAVVPPLPTGEIPHASIPPIRFVEVPVRTPDR